MHRPYAAVVLSRGFFGSNRAKNDPAAWQTPHTETALPESVSGCSCGRLTIDLGGGQINPARGQSLMRPIP